MRRSAATFSEVSESDADTVCSLIQPLCNTVYTSNKGLDEPTRHGIAVEPVNAGERL